MQSVIHECYTNMYNTQYSYQLLTVFSSLSQRNSISPVLKLFQIGRQINRSVSIVRNLFLIGEANLRLTITYTILVHVVEGQISQDVIRDVGLEYGVLILKAEYLKRAKFRCFVKKKCRKIGLNDYQNLESITSPSFLRA